MYLGSDERPRLAIAVSIGLPVEPGNAQRGEKPQVGAQRLREGRTLLPTQAM